MTTSDRRVSVYLQLPQSLEIVTAGYYELDFPQGVATGSYVYNPACLDRRDALPIEPYELPLSPRRTTTVRLKGIFGALRDASPDAWGRCIIERRMGRLDLNEVDCLLHSPEDRAGALSFGREKRDLAMTCGRFNRYANRANLLSEHAQFKRSLDQARAIVDQVQQVVAARWLPMLRQHGVSNAECERLIPAFNYPGFELDPPQVL